MNIWTRRLLAALATTTLLAGCGGGGGGDSGTPFVPQPTVSSGAAGTPVLNQTLLLTLNGSNLDAGITVASPGCSGVTRSTTAPNISSAAVAFYTCTVSAVGAQQFNVTRTSDGVSLATVVYTVPAPVALPTVSSSAAGTSAFNQTLLLTLNGSNLDAGIAVASPGCSGVTRSTTPPNVSTAAVAFYTCTVSAVGAQQFNVTRSSDSASLATVPYTVPVPQVTVNVSNGAGLTGSFVITLSPTLTPVTTVNFLTYVNAGFYTGTVFHRHSPNFVLQGGGFAGPMNPSQPVPALKATNPPIALEVGRGLSNVRWTVAMARTSVLNSATSQFFINLVDNVFLDTASGGYTVFGSVTGGTDFITTALTGICVAYPALQALPDCLFVPNLTIIAATQTR